MDIKDIKENKQSLAENLKVLLMNFEQLNGVKVNTVIISRVYNVAGEKKRIAVVDVEVEI